MKTVIDKIDANPPHAFSPGELRMFLRMLPIDLLQDVSLVRLSSAIEHSASIHVARFSRLEQRLVITSRGVSRDQAMLEVIRCLIRSNQRRSAAYGQGQVQLPAPEVERRATEMLAQLQGQMPKPLHWNRVELKYAHLTQREIA